MLNKQKTLKPFIKWVGGKTQILAELRKRIPPHYRSYSEPFVGGGAFFLNLLPEKAFLSDKNSNLIDAWQILRNYPTKLIEALSKWSKTKITEKIYLENRSKYNLLSQKSPLSESERIEKAALFIVLNKTCFNGLYRVNAKGEFNVPWNKKKQFTFDAENLFNLSKYLQKSQTKIFVEDFEESISRVQGSDFIYLDPPYSNLQNKKTFTAYTSDSFDISQQNKLANTFKKLHRRGCYVMLSNHDTPLIRNLYQDFHIFRLSTRRSINSDGTKRNNGQELIITNYDWKKELERTFIENPDWYVDFDKVNVKIANLKHSLQKIQQLRYAVDIEKAFIELIQKDREVLELLPLLLATRWKSFKMKQIWKLKEGCLPTALQAKEIFTFFARTNIFNLFLENRILNLYDYLIGIETGMDTNARKNRTGTMFEEEITKILNKFKVAFYKQKYLSDILNIYSQDIINSQPVSDVLEKKKKLDFVFKKNKIIYLMECNYYNAEGSKINETIRSYQKFQRDVDQSFSNIRFIWISDGPVWEANSAKFAKIQTTVPLLMKKQQFIEWIQKLYKTDEQ